MDGVTEKPVEPSISSDPIAETVAGIGEAVHRNTALATGQAPPAPNAGAGGGGGASWRMEPIDNFELDGGGKVKLRPNGSPIRKGGRPKKARPGDLLADGTIKPGGAAFNRPHGTTPEAAGRTATPSAAVEAPGGSTVVIPGLEDPHDENGGAGSSDTGGDAGEEFGGVVAEGITNVCNGLAGENPRRKLTGNEKASLDKHLGRGLGGVTINPWTAVLIVLAFYLLRIFIDAAANRRKKVENTADADPSTDNRTNPERENDSRQAARGGLAGKVWS